MNISVIKQLIAYGLFVLTTGILILDRFMPLEITNSNVYFCILITSIILLTSIILIFWLKLNSDRLIFFSILTVVFLFIVAYIFTWRLEWKTQTIIYKSRHFANRTIEFQMQDLGELGSNRRTVDRLKIFPYFDWTNKIDLEKIDTLTWEKVDIEIDDKLGL